MRRRTYLAAGATAVVGAFAGCLGGDAGDGDGTETTADPDTTTDDPTTTDSNETTDGAATTDGATSTDDQATVTVATSEEYGEYLADGEGMTLYLFTDDEGGESTCYDGCAQTWPPLTVEGSPTAGEGVTAELGTTERDDGSAQVTAGDWPLYYYAPDESPGDVNGQGVGDVWFLLAPDGTAIEGDGAATDGGGDAATNDSDGGTDDEGSNGGGSDGGGYRY